MKGLYFCGICFVAVIGVLPCKALLAEELPWEKKLPFENATIHYAVSGVEQGTEILYIRNFGREQATYLDSTTKIMGMAVSEKAVDFMDADYVYSYDLQAQEGTKSVNPQKYMTEAYSRLTPEEKKQVQENVAQTGGALTGGMGGAVQENVAKILGYDCDKIDIMGGGATYLIHGTSIALKTEVNMMGMKMFTLATSVDTGKVDPQHFIHPKGIEAKANPEADAMAQAMGQQVMAALKDPEARKIESGVGQQNDALKKNMTEEDKQMLEQAGELLKGMQNIFGQ